MATKEHANNYAAPWNIEPNKYQSDDKESDVGAEDGPGNIPQGPIRVVGS